MRLSAWRISVINPLMVSAASCFIVFVIVAIVSLLVLRVLHGAGQAAP
jgi:hypothetical protein